MSLDVAYPVSAVLTMLIPIVIVVVLILRLNTGWRPAVVGMGTYFLAGLLFIVISIGLGIGLTQLPGLSFANATLFIAMVAGIVGGILYEIARYLGYRNWLPEAKTLRESAAYGLGFGGLEALFAGLGALITYFLTSFSQSMLAAQQGQLTALSPEEQEQVQFSIQQMERYFSVPWHEPFMLILQVVFMLGIHVALAALVLRAYQQKDRLWLVVAIVWHSFVSLLAGYSLITWNQTVSAIVVGVLAAISLGAFFALRGDDSPSEDVTSTASPA